MMWVQPVSLSGRVFPKFLHASSAASSSISICREKTVIYKGRIPASLTSGILVAVAAAPPAHADDRVTYEVLSLTPYVKSLNVEYYDHSERISLDGVSLPWRQNATAVNPRSQTEDGAEVRADWQPVRAPDRWVTVRIYVRGSLICENTLDVGNATCYGSTPFIS